MQRSPTRSTARIEQLAAAMVLLVFAGLGCEARATSKLSEAQCRGATVAGERPANCGDPSCWYYDFCSPALYLHPKADAGASAQGAGDAATTSQARRDAGSTPVDDAGSAMLPDANTVVDPCAKVSCKTGGTCVNGQCMTPPINAMSYLFRVKAAAVPIEAPAPTFKCFDTVTLTNICSVSPAAVCGTCLPDPYVITSINGAQVAMTSVVTDSVAPTWNDPKSQVTLAVGDALEFRVMDSDPGQPKDDPIFTCTVMITDAILKAGVVTCHPDMTMVVDPPLGVDWFVSAEISPAPTIQ